MRALIISRPGGFRHASRDDSACECNLGVLRQSSGLVRLQGFQTRSSSCALTHCMCGPLLAITLHVCVPPRPTHQAKGTCCKIAGLDVTALGYAAQHDLIQQLMRGEGPPEAAPAGGTADEGSTGAPEQAYESPYAGLPPLLAGQPGALTKEVRGGKHALGRGRGPEVSVSASPHVSHALS